MHTAHYGTPITEENIPAMIEFMAQFDLNISDDVDDIIEYYAYTGETPFAVMQLTSSGSRRISATFTIIGSETFHPHWNVLVAEKYGPFYQIEKI